MRIIIVAKNFKNILLSLSQYITDRFQIHFAKYGRYRKPKFTTWYIAFQVKGRIKNIFGLSIKKIDPPAFYLRFGKELEKEENEDVKVILEKYKFENRGDEFWYKNIENPEEIYKFEELLEYVYNKYSRV